MVDPQLRPAPRWVAPMFALFGAGTIPWTVFLSLTLPDHARTHDYRLAWVGFDALLILALLATAYLAWRGDSRVGLLAAGVATMLVVDAWFDVTTASPPDRPVSIVLAVCVELPLAVLCGWIALHADRVVAACLAFTSRLGRQADLPPLRTLVRSTAPGPEPDPESRPGESRPGESRPGESRPGESRPGESRLAGAGPAGASL